MTDTIIGRGHHRVSSVSASDCVAKNNRSKPITFFYGHKKSPFLSGAKITLIN